MAFIILKAQQEVLLILLSHTHILLDAGDINMNEGKYLSSNIIFHSLMRDRNVKIKEKD